MKQDFYRDKDVMILSYTTDNGTIFTISNKLGSSSYLVLCPKIGVAFNVDTPDMGVHIMRLILGEWYVLY